VGNIHWPGIEAEVQSTWNREDRGVVLSCQVDCGTATIRIASSLVASGNETVAVCDNNNNERRGVDDRLSVDAACKEVSTGKTRYTCWRATACLQKRPLRSFYLSITT
jgi:hypothetical protein